MDDRERARETNFVGRETCKFHSGDEKMRNASGQVKMSGSEKIKANMNTGNKIFGKTRKFEVLVVQNGIIVVQNNGKERQKKRAACANFLFLLIREKSVLNVQICFFAN